jgi:KDO2-lipid IV(A) lauroyltransferase
MDQSQIGVKGADQLKPHHIVEYGLMRLVLGTASLFGLDRSSAFGGWIARKIGPMTSAHKTATDNMKAAFPDMVDVEIQSNLNSMWDNFGRTMFEMPQLTLLEPYVEDSRVEVMGGEIVDRVLKEGNGAIFVSGHFANWEAMAPCIRLRGFELNGVYRSANNPLVNKWTIRIRGNNSFSSLAPKGPAGAKIIVQNIRKGIPVAMLIDQKMNEGLDVPLFGRNAKTPGAPAQLSEKYDCPIIPTHIMRTGGANFRVTFYSPLEVEKTGSKSDDIMAIATAYNKFLEECIQRAPRQWMWMHNRWSDSKKAQQRRKRKAAKKAVAEQASGGEA